MSDSNHEQLIAKSSFTIVPDALIEDERLSGDAKLLYMLIASHTRKDKPTAFPGRERLMRMAGFKKYRLDNAKKELETIGWIEVHRAHGKPNTYLVNQTSPVTRLHQSNDQTTTSPVTRPEEEQIKNNNQQQVVADKKEPVKEDPVDVSMEFLTTIGLTDNPPLREKVATAIENGIAPEEMGDFFHYLLSLARGKENPRGWAISQLPVSEHVHKFRASVEPVPTKEVKTIFDEPLEEEQPATPEQAKEYFDKLHKVLSFPDNSNDKEESEAVAMPLF